MGKALQFNAYIQHYVYGTLLQTIKMEPFPSLFSEKRYSIEDWRAGN